jgi:hypothetical protein
MSKFTPGPRETKNGHDIFTRLGAENASSERCDENDGWHIADVQMDDRLSWPEQRANARLIAAAPNMHAELVKARAALWRVIEDNCGGQPEDYAEIRSIDEVLARATGGNDE